MNEPAETITVEVAWGTPEHQELLTVHVPEGTTAIEAVNASGLRERVPEADISEERLGVFGRKVSPDQVLRTGDRVEIYRPLLIDPKEARRARAEAAKSSKASGVNSRE